LTFQLAQRRDAGLDVQPTFTRVGEDIVIGSTAFADDEGRRSERFQVLTLRGGKIVDIQGCATRREADGFARRAATS
jgi:hypothetical protein